MNTQNIWIERLQDGAINLYRVASKKKRLQTGSKFLIWSHNDREWLPSTIKLEVIRKLPTISIKFDRITWKGLMFDTKNRPRQGH